MFPYYGIIWFLIGKTMYFCHLAISTRFGVIDSFFCLFLSWFVALLFSWSYLLSEVEWERTCLTAFYQCVLWVHHPSPNQCPDSSQILLWRLSLMLGNNLNLECFSFTVESNTGRSRLCVALQQFWDSTYQYIICATLLFYLVFKMCAATFVQQVVVYESLLFCLFLEAVAF